MLARLVEGSAIFNTQKDIRTRFPRKKYWEPKLLFDIFSEDNKFILLYFFLYALHKQL